MWRADGRGKAHTMCCFRANYLPAACSTCLSAVKPCQRRSVPLHPALSKSVRHGCFRNCKRNNHTEKEVAELEKERKKKDEEEEEEDEEEKKRFKGRRGQTNEVKREEEEEEEEKEKLTRET